MINKKLKGVLEYSSKELTKLAQTDTPDTFKRRTKLGRPKHLSTHVDFERDAVLVLLNSHDHEVVLRFEQFLSLVADELVTQYNSHTTRNDLVKLAKLAIRVCMEYGDVRVDCDCDDYKYRYNWLARQYDYALVNRNVGHDYAPDQTNPTKKGGICKHISQVLSSMSLWYDSVSRDIIRDITKNKDFLSKVEDKVTEYNDIVQSQDEDLNDTNSEDLITGKESEVDE